MIKRGIGFTGLIVMAFGTIACSTADTVSGTKANTDTIKTDTSKTDAPKDQASAPGPGQGHEMMEKGMKMDGKEHPKEGSHP